MRSKYTVPLKTIVQEMHLEALHLSSNYDTALLTMADVNRPAMQLTGFYNYFDPKRIQVIGRVESTYLDTLSHEARLEAFDRFMTYDIAALVICLAPIALFYVFASRFMIEGLTAGAVKG